MASMPGRSVDGRSGAGPSAPRSRAMDATLLDKIAAEQAGLFTRSQARACGYSGYQIRRLLRTGEWHLIFGSVLSRAGVSVTPRVRDRAVYLALGGSVLAGPSA